MTRAIGIIGLDWIGFDWTDRDCFLLRISFRCIKSTLYNSFRIDFLLGGGISQGIGEGKETLWGDFHFHFHFILGKLHLLSNSFNHRFAH